MNWSKIKNIMIILLVGINVFLLINIAINNYSSKTLPKDAGSSFEKLLAQKDISMKKELIPKYYESRHKASAEFYDIDTLTKMFIGNKAEYSSEGTSIVATMGDRTLIMDGNRIEYKTKKPAVKKNGEDIIKAMENLGISTLGAVFVEEEKLVKVRLDSMDLEGVYLDIALSSDGEICFLEGVWPEIVLEDEKISASVLSAVAKICEKVPNGAEIDYIESVYALESAGDAYSIKPAWKIRANDEMYLVTNS